MTGTVVPTRLGPVTLLTWASCRHCLRPFVGRRNRMAYFCTTECEARFAFERRRVNLCLYPPCLNTLVRQGGGRRKYCSDDCCARAYWDRHGGSIAGQRTTGRPPKYSDPVRSRLEQMTRDRQRWVKDAPPPKPPRPEPAQAPPRAATRASEPSIAIDIILAARYGGRINVVRSGNGNAFSGRSTTSEARGTFHRYLTSSANGHQGAS